MTNENDDWEVAVDTGEFDKRIEEQEKDAARQLDLFKTTVMENSENRNLINLNKPIRILKRPTSQPQLPVSNETNNSSQIPSSNVNSSFSNEISSTSNSTIKTYEQREQEYRLARLRIMGEEESSAKDDDDDVQPTIESTPITSDDTSRITQNPANYTTGAIHFIPNTNPIGPYSQTQYHPVYSAPYPSMPLPRYPPVPLYNFPVQPSANPWYPYPQERTQQYGHPQ